MRFKGQVDASIIRESDQDRGTVRGQVNNIEFVQSPHGGESIKFHGMFQVEVGDETKTGASLFLPGAGEQFLNTLFNSEGPGVAFEFDLEQVKEEDSITGYVWEVVAEDDRYEFNQMIKKQLTDGKHQESTQARQLRAEKAHAEQNDSVPQDA